MVRNLAVAPLVEILEKVSDPSLLGVHIVKGGLAAVGADSFIPPGSRQGENPANSHITRWGDVVGTKKASPRIPKTVIEDEGQIDNEPVIRLRGVADKRVEEGVGPARGKTKLSIKEIASATSDYTVTVDVLDAVCALSALTAPLSCTAEVAGRL